MNTIASHCITTKKTPHGVEASGCFLGFTIHAYGITESHAIGKAAEQMREILREYKATCIANIRARCPGFQLGKIV